MTAPTTRLICRSRLRLFHLSPEGDAHAHGRASAARFRGLLRVGACGLGVPNSILDYDCFIWAHIYGLKVLILMNMPSSTATSASDVVRLTTLVVLMANMSQIVHMIVSCG